MTNKSNTLDNVHIGQTIFIVMNDSLKIVPAIIAEKTHIETLTESSIVWKVMVGPEEKRKVYPLDKISGDKFATLEEARMEMLRSFHESLGEEIEDAISKAMSWYKIPKSQISINKVVSKPPVANKQEEGEDEDDDEFDPHDLLNASNVHVEKDMSSVKKTKKQKTTTVSAPLVNFNHQEVPAAEPAVKRPAAKKQNNVPTSRPKPTSAQEALRQALDGGDDDEFVEYGDTTPVQEGQANVIMPDGERIRVTL